MLSLASAALISEMWERPLFSADKYAVRFIPHENGIHSIDVKFNGSHVVGSPFKVRVGEPGQAGNPTLVTAYGPGLESGTTGNPSCTAPFGFLERARSCF